MWTTKSFWVRVFLHLLSLSNWCLDVVSGEVWEVVLCVRSTSCKWRDASSQETLSSQWQLPSVAPSLHFFIIDTYLVTHSSYTMTVYRALLEYNRVMNVSNTDWINRFIRSALPKGSSQDRISKADTIAGLEPVIVGYRALQGSTLPVSNLPAVLGWWQLFQKFSEFWSAFAKLYFCHLLTVCNEIGHKAKYQQLVSIIYITIKGL